MPAQLMRLEVNLTDPESGITASRALDVNISQLMGKNGQDVVLISREALSARMKAMVDECYLDLAADVLVDAGN